MRIERDAIERATRADRSDRVADLVEQHHEDLQRVDDRRVPQQPESCEEEPEAEDEAELAVG